MIYVLSGGQTGATLTVNSSGAGTITVSNTTLGKSYSKSVTAGGSVVFKGLKTGTWTVKLTDGSRTSTKTITITSDYSTSIAYFSATISITYPAKSTCVVKNSSGQTVASNTNTGTSTKTWTATVNAAGTYTVTATATDGTGKTKSTTVSITATGQSKSVELAYATYLFKAGEGALVPFEKANETFASISLSTSQITTSFSDSRGYQIACFTKNKIDLSEYNYLIVRATVTELPNPLSELHRGVACVVSGDVAIDEWVHRDNDNSEVVAKTNFTVKSGAFEVSLAGLSGSYRVGVKGGFKSTITSIELI